ncbi:MAG: hypothetical protein RLY97_634 [Pseudomonadota bacterium]
MSTILKFAAQREVKLRLLAMAAAMATAGAILHHRGDIYGTGMMASAATLLGDEPTGVAPMPFEKAGQSFPGSAYYYLAADDPYATGKALDGQASAGDMPLNDHGQWDGTNLPSNNGLIMPGPAARAISQAGNATDQSRALTCLTQAVYFEAASEPDGGQRAVAQVVLNRMAHPSFPKSVCGVVFQGSERSTGCQFSFTCDGALRRKPVALFWKRAEDVARAALGGYVYAPVSVSTHYHTFAIHPYWADSLNFIGQIGAHRFYRMKGPAGSSAAFRFAYAGGEPVTRGNLGGGAVVPSGNAIFSSSPDPLAIERAYEARLKAAHGDVGQVGVMISPAHTYAAPAYTGEALQRGGDNAFRAKNLPSSELVMPEHQSSGQWINEPQ